MTGIIGAMDEEIDLLRDSMEDTIEEVHASMTFYKGRLWGQDVTVVRSGIGKVNMAVCTQLLVDFYHADALINTGVAGSLDSRIDIGDIVIGVNAVHHDMDTSAFGDPPGQVPRMDILAFPSDSHLIRCAEEADLSENPDIKTFCGRVASGDQFIGEEEDKNRIVRLFGALCCDMEGAAMAQTAYLNGVPCLIIRAISDKADHSATMNYSEFEQKAIYHTMRLLKGLLERLS